ncbi:MAG: PAS domain S-box protein [Sterolibacterium sp.]
MDSVSVSPAVIPQQENREWLHLVADAALDAIVMIDNEGRISLWNKAAERIFGYAASEALGKDVHALITPQRYLAASAQAFSHFRTTGEGAALGKTLELYGIRKSGGEFPLELSLSALNYRGNWLAVGMVRDITERKQADLALQQSENKFRSIIELSPVPYALNDLQQNVTLLNPAFVKAFGYSMEDIPTLSDWWLKAYPDRKYREWVTMALRDRLAKVKQEGTEFEPLEVNICCKDGRVRTAMIFLANLGESFNGTHLSILHDVTERKQLEQSLRKSAALLKQAQEITRVAGWEYDVAAGKMEWTEEAYRIFGVPTGYDLDDVAQDIELFFAPEARPHLMGAFTRLVEQAEPYDLELPFVSATGKSKWVKTTGRAEFVDGSVRRVFGCIVDITGRKRAEAKIQGQFENIATINAQLIETNKQLTQAHNQLLQSEKMASIGLLAAGVAHEINNPVGYVYSNLGTLEKYLADILSMVSKYEEAERLMDAHTQEIGAIRQFKAQIDLDYLRQDIHSLLAESREGLMRVKKIVLDLKDFSHIGDNEGWKWADLQQGLESTLNVVWNELKYKCEVVKEYGALPQIPCLPMQLNQVFMNLLVNAAQAIDSKGTVTIRTGQEGDRVWVEIADTGRGIPPENLPHLFDPFFTTKPVGQGTGLGLSVSYSIVEKHHGKIEVHSEVGKGATFRVWLPVKQENIPQA